MLNLSQKLAYGLPALPLAAMGVTYYVYLPKYYTDELGLSLTLLGLIILFSRIWDALLDPLLGWFSDRGATKYGRRKIWLLSAVLPLAAAFSALTVLDLLNPDSRAAAFAAISFFFFLAWTAFTVPYEAWGAEISPHYHERTGLLSFREGAVVAGTLLSAALPLGLGLLQPAAPELPLLAMIYSLMLLLATGFCLKQVPEHHWAAARLPSGNPWSGLRQLKGNRPFIVLLTAYLISGIGAALPASLILFFAEHVIGTNQGSLILLIYFAVGLLSVPLWVKLSNRFGKKEAWLGAMALNTGAFALVLLLGWGDFGYYALATALSALGYGGVLVLPASMQADVIDLEEFLSGVRREGLMVGVWSVVKKGAAAVGAGTALTLLGLSGYQAGSPPSPLTLNLLTGLYAGVPCLANITAMLVLTRYQLSEQEHRSIAAKLPKDQLHQSWESAAP